MKSPKEKGDYGNVCSTQIWATHTLTHTDLWGDKSVSLFALSTNNHPVQNIRMCSRIIYMFVCSPTSCLGVVNVDIDQNHQLWRSLPGSTINEVQTCQLNPGQREEANVCFNISASSQRGLDIGLTPGLTALPDHTLWKQSWGNAMKRFCNPQRNIKGDRLSLLKTFFRSAGRSKSGDVYCKNICYFYGHLWFVYGVNVNWC